VFHRRFQHAFLCLAGFTVCAGARADAEVVFSNRSHRDWLIRGVPSGKGTGGHLEVGGTRG